MNNSTHAFKIFQKFSFVYSNGNHHYSNQLHNAAEQEDIWRAFLPRLQQIFNLLVWLCGVGFLFFFLSHNIRKPLCKQ